MSDRTLQNEVALVTGSGRRIGRSIALELARAGADIIVHVNRSRDEGEAVVAEIQAMGRRAALVTADQRSVDEIERACDEAMSALGPITILVNNAAVWPRAKLADVDEELFDLAIESNLRGPFFWARRLGLEMKANGRGAIVSIADVMPERPWGDSIPYCAAKAGVITMTVGMAKELAPEVRVNAIGPGPILFPAGYSDDEVAADRAATLLEREGTPEDIARAVRFLCEAPYVTGVFLPVDGGFRFGL